MGLLNELREATPLAERLANAALDAAEGYRQAATAAATIKLPTPAAAQSATSAPLSSSGGGGGGGGLIAAPQQVRSVDRKLVKSTDWLNEHCQRTTFSIPNPRNRNAAAENDMVTVGGWDCSGELHMVADFYDPAEMARLRGDPKPLSASQSGGPSGGGGDSSGRGDPTLGRTGAIPGFRNVGTGVVNPLVGSSGSSSVGVSGPLQVTDPALAEQTRLLREIRDQGRADAGLSRRVGGRP
jgi:hypothetical protein